jgi:hypothetical protein
VGRPSPSSTRMGTARCRSTSGDEDDRQVCGGRQRPIGLAEDRRIRHDRTSYAEEKALFVLILSSTRRYWLEAV